MLRFVKGGCAYTVDERKTAEHMARMMQDDDTDDIAITDLGDEELIALIGTVLAAGKEIDNELRDEIMRRTRVTLADMLICEGFAKPEEVKQDEH